MQKRLAKYQVRSSVLDARGIKERFPAVNVDPYPEFDPQTGEETGRHFGEVRGGTGRHFGEVLERRGAGPAAILEG